MEIPFFEPVGFSEESPEEFFNSDFFSIQELNSKSAAVTIKPAQVNFMESSGMNFPVKIPITAVTTVDAIMARMVFLPVSSLPVRISSES